MSNFIMSFMSPVVLARQPLDPRSAHSVGNPHDAKYLERIPGAAEYIGPGKLAGTVEKYESLYGRCKPENCNEDQTRFLGWEDEKDAREFTKLISNAFALFAGYGPGRTKIPHAVHLNERADGKGYYEIGLSYGDVAKIGAFMEQLKKAAPLSGISLDSRFFLDHYTTFITDISRDYKGRSQSLEYIYDSKLLQNAIQHFRQNKQLFADVDQPSQYGTRGNFAGTMTEKVYKVFLEMVQFNASALTGDLSNSDITIKALCKSHLFLWTLSQSELDSYKPRITELRNHYLKKDAFDRDRDSFKLQLEGSLDFFGCHKATRAFALSIAEKELEWFNASGAESKRKDYEEKSRYFSLNDFRNRHHPCAHLGLKVFPAQAPLTDCSRKAYEEKNRLYLETMGLMARQDGAGAAAEG